jgi:hypothetical protein
MILRLKIDAREFQQFKANLLSFFRYLDDKYRPRLKDRMSWKKIFCDTPIFLGFKKIVIFLTLGTFLCHLGNMPITDFSARTKDKSFSDRKCLKLNKICTLNLPCILNFLYLIKKNFVIKFLKLIRNRDRFVRKPLTLKTLNLSSFDKFDLYDKIDLILPVSIYSQIVLNFVGYLYFYNILINFSKNCIYWNFLPI